MRVRCIAISAMGFFLVACVQVATAATPGDECNLPQELQHEVDAKYPKTKLVTLSDLSEQNRTFFQKDHGVQCPGMVKADFYGDGKTSLALVLLPNNGATEEAKLVLAHQVGRRWQSAVVDTANVPPVPVVWSQPPGKYRDVYGTKEIRATSPVIVFAGYESWAIVYAWTGKDLDKVWIAD